jgi:hydroxymethylbilane synthase
VKVVVGTRGSALALRQAREVVARLQALDPSLEVEERLVRTHGDDVRDRPLYLVGQRGAFVKRLEEALLRGEVDLAVHSLKDLPVEEAEGLVLAAIPARADPRDVLVSRGGARLADLPPGARVGTSSRRRAAQVRHLRPDLALQDLRGNLDTRLRKVREGEVDAAVLAAAGLERLGLASLVAERFDVEVLVPAPGQGALAVQVREGDRALRDLAAALDHGPTRQATQAERAFLKRVGGGCALPIGAYAEVRGAALWLVAMLASVDGGVLVKGVWEGPASAWEALVARAADELLEAFRGRAGVPFGASEGEEA